MARPKALGAVLVALLAVGILIPAVPAEAAAPGNDDFDNATVAALLPFADSLVTTEATSAGDDPSCSSGGGHTVWYDFTPGSPMRIQASTVWSDYGTVLSVWTGARGALSPVDCANNTLGYQEQINFDGVSGTTYHFMVAADGTGAGGTLSFALRTFSPAPNDDFDNATDLTALPITDSIDSTGATTAVDDPVPSCSPRAKTVWYTITPSQNIRVTLDSLESVYDTNLSVYTGIRGDLTEVACNDNQAYYGMARLGFDAVGGTTYHIMLASWEFGAGGDWVLAAKQGLLHASLGLTISKKKVGYKGSANVTVHLDAYQDTDNDVVKIFKTPYGGAKVLVASGKVNSKGNFSASVVLTKKTAFVASWGGEQRYAPAASNSRSVSVYVALGARLLHFYARSGHFRLYHYTPNCPKRHTGCPTYKATVLPNHAGKKVSFRLQVFVKGAWHDALSFSGRLNAKSQFTAIFFYRSSAVINIPTRVRCSFAGDADHLGKTSPWSFFKVTM